MRRFLFLFFGFACGLLAKDFSVGDIDDAEVEERLIREGSVLIAAGEFTKVKTLRGQLAKRARCSVSLPEAGSELLSPEAIHARSRPGVLVVGLLGWCDACKKYEVSGSTGFALTRDGVFVTNYHVIDSEEDEAVVIMGVDGKVVAATEVLAGDPLADVAIVRAAGAILAPIPLAAEKAAVGAPVWVLSHPDHNFWSFTQGMVSRHVVSDTDQGKTPQIAITADFGAGSSGGPVLDARGNVTGMVCSTSSVYFTAEKEEEAGDLQMVFKHCVPVGSIRRVVGEP